MSELSELSDGVLDLVARLAAALARQLASSKPAGQASSPLQTEPKPEKLSYSVHIDDPSTLGKPASQIVEMLRAGPLPAEDIAKRLGMHVATVEAELQRLDGMCFIPVQAWMLCATFGQPSSPPIGPAPPPQPQPAAERQTEAKRKQATPLSDEELARRIQAAKDGRLEKRDAEE